MGGPSQSWKRGSYLNLPTWTLALALCLAGGRLWRLSGRARQDASLLSAKTNTGGGTIVCWKNDRVCAGEEGPTFGWAMQIPPGPLVRLCAPRPPASASASILASRRPGWLCTGSLMMVQWEEFWPWPACWRVNWAARLQGRPSGAPAQRCGLRAEINGPREQRWARRGPAGRPNRSCARALARPPHQAGELAAPR